MTPVSSVRGIMANLLPGDKTFRQSFLPFFIPYALYVAIEALPLSFLSPEAKHIIKLISIVIDRFYLIIGKEFWNNSFGNHSVFERKNHLVPSTSN